MTYDENYQGFLRWNCDAKKSLLTANMQIVKIQSNVSTVENPPLPPRLFKLFKNMHIWRCVNHNITKNAQICDISKSK